MKMNKTAAAITAGIITFGAMASASAAGIVQINRLAYNRFRADHFFKFFKNLFSCIIIHRGFLPVCTARTDVPARLPPSAIQCIPHRRE